MGFSRLKEKLSLHHRHGGSASKTKPESSTAPSPRPASIAVPGSETEQSQQTVRPEPSPVPSQVAPPIPDKADRDVPIRELWNSAYEKLRAEEEALVRDYEAKLSGDLGAGLGSMLGATAMRKREQLDAILQRKMDEINRETWKLRFGSNEYLVKDLAEPALGAINRVNEYISGALASNPYASIAWTGVSMLLPLLLNPSKQAASLASGLDHISGLIAQSRMWEELYARRYESKATDERGSRDSSFTVSHVEYRNALESLYKEILRFQVSSYCYYTHHSTSRLGRDMVKWDDWDTLLDDVRQRECVFKDVCDIWRDMKYDEECEAADERHRESMRRWDAIGDDVTGLRRAVEDAQRDEKRANLLNWLCDIDPSAMYNAARDKHEEGTGDWLVRDNKKFWDWEEEPGSFLWLHGKAGCGKSILSSTVIQYLRDEYWSDPRTALAYFYFSFSDAKKQDVRGMLASLVKQLCARRPVLPQVMESLHEYAERGERPDAKTLERILMAAMGGFSGVYIVIDALDECPVSKGERRRLLDTIRRIATAAPTNLHLFCTSRKETDIDAVLSPLWSPPQQNLIDLTVAKDIIDADIGRYIDSMLASPDFDSWPSDVKMEAREVLIERADGMFQYVAHQFDALRDLSSVVLIRRALSELPVGLDDTYARLLEAIDPKFESQVANTLKWLAFSSHDFDMGQLAEIFILRPDRTPVLDQAERLFKPQDVLKYLSGLVLEYGTSPVYESDDSEDDEPRGKRRVKYFAEFKVRLAHFSIREYLVSDRVTGPAARFACSETEAHLHIARSCLAYHLQYLSMNHHLDFRRRDFDFRLRDYATSAWPVHLEMVPRELWPPDIVDAASRALAVCSRSLGSMLDMLEKDRHRDNPFAQPVFDMYGGGRGEEPWAHVMLRLPQCLTARFGFVQLTDMLFASREYPTQEDLDQALIAAAYGGNTAVVDLLLDRGAHADARDKVRGSALLAAAVAGHTATVERLLNRGADIDAQFSVSSYTSALQAACEERRTLVIELLVSRGANVNLPGVLASAIASIYDSNDPAEPITELRLLCDSGADIHTDLGGEYGTPLHVAAMDARSEAFDFLVQRGADVNAYGGKYGYPLQALCHSGKYGADDDRTLAQVELLLARGADINARGGKYGSALQCACHHHSEGSRVVQLLLDRGADAHARGGHFDTTLQAACTAKYTQDIVERLLEMHVDVHAQGGYYGNALQAACYHLNLEVATQLLDLGVDVNASGGEYGSALQAAVASNSYEDEDVVRLLQLLLQRGADVNQCGGRYGTALQAAAAMAKPEVVRFLLEHGADVNLQGGEHGTALLAATYLAREDSRIVPLLLEHGADINLEGGVCHTVLQAACQPFYLQSVFVPLDLLDRGANVHAHGGKWGTAWHAAAARTASGFEMVLAGMLVRGVDVNDTRGRIHATALHAAIESKDHWGSTQDRIRFLLDWGADINIQAGPYGTPLQSACCCARRPDPSSPEANDVLEFLLTDCPGIDVNAQGGMFGSALQAAAYHGRARMVEMLLEHGANVNPPRGGKCGSPLNAAVIAGYWNIVKVLLEAGATPDCELLPEPDEEWLAQIGKEHGRGAVERYRVFWDRHKAEYGLGNNLVE